MPAFTMPGMASGQDTNNIVKQLVELEKKPIQRWEMDNAYSSAQIEAWTELRKKTQDLQNKAKNLTTFTSPLATKKIKSSQDGVISGEAGRGAKPGKKTIEVLELATHHQISGNPIDSEKPIPEGKFTILVGKEKLELEFKGKNLSDLARLLKNSAASLVTTNLIRLNREESTLSLSSVRSGEKNKMKFLDPDGVLKAAGLVGDYVPPPEPTVQELYLSWEGIRSVQDEKFENNIKQDSKPYQDPNTLHVILPPFTAYSFPVKDSENAIVKKDASLRFVLPEGNLPARLDVGLYFRDLNQSEERYRQVSLYPKEGQFEWELNEIIQGKKMERIVLLNGKDSNLEIQKIEMVIPPEDWIGAEPTNVITEAKDAVFRIDGIEMKRETNENINDVLEAVSFHLHKTTDGPIPFEIEPEIQKGKELIKEFVKSYNELIIYCRDMTYVERDGKLSTKESTDDTDRRQSIDKEFWKNKEKTGLLAGDNSVLRLVSGLKTIISGAYPNKQEQGYKTLAEIGISTGRIGSNWDKIQEGILQIDDDILNQALNENPDAVKELFASDLNNDAITDEGVGFRIVEHLKPYTQFAGGLITGKIKFLEEKITDNKKKIKNHESHLLAYENKLKQRFLYMEQGVGKNKTIGNYLQNNLRMGQSKE